MPQRPSSSTNGSSTERLRATKKQRTIGRQPATLKRHLRVHGRKWAVAGGVLIALVLTAFVVWSVQVSIDFYAARERPSVPAPVSPNPISTKSRAIDGPVELRFDVGDITTSERVVFLRDAQQILSDRLRENGIEVANRSENVLEVHYKEYRDNPIRLMQSGPKGPEAVAEVPGVKAFIQLTLSKPSQAISLGEETVNSGLKDIEIDGNRRVAQSRHSNRVKQLTYTNALAFLRKVDLPVTD